jgi:site-specific recombinase XerD
MPHRKPVFDNSRGWSAGRYRLPLGSHARRGLRWSEQMTLRWRDVDMLAGVITIQRSKNGHTRRVPMNSAVKSILIDLGSRRSRPDDSSALVFVCRHAQADKFFPKAVEKAQRALRQKGKDAGRLDGYTWHGNRHTFASRLVMAGVDPRTVQELGGWRTLAMVQRYSHLDPEHLQSAVERLVAAPEATEVARK